MSVDNGTGKAIIPDLPDKRSLGMPDKPYSGYCKVCWQPMYCSTIEPHDQICKQVKEGETQCENAKAWMRNMALLRGDISQ